MPEILTTVRGNRKFLARAVRFLRDAGVRQFLDIGSGLPSTPNVHEIAQEGGTGARVVYVDHDAVVCGHARALLGLRLQRRRGRLARRVKSFTGLPVTGAGERGDRLPAAQLGRPPREGERVGEDAVGGEQVGEHHGFAGHDLAHELCDLAPGAGHADLL
jgi:hypothetical protein